MMKNMIPAVVMLAVLGACTSQECTEAGTTPPVKAAPAKPAVVTPAKKVEPAPVAATPAVGMIESALSFPTGGECDPLVVTLSTPATVNLGETYCYVIRAHNRSNGTLKNVVVKNSIPEGFTVEGGDLDANGNWDVGTLKAGESKNVKVCGKATREGVLSDCLTANFLLHNCVATQVVRKEINLVKSAPAQSLVCDPVELSYTVQNSGSAVAPAVVIRDTLPQGLTLADGSSKVEIPVGDLAPGQSATRKVMAKATKIGNLGSEAVAATGNLERKAAASTKFVKPVLSIDQTGPEQVFIGRPAAYSATVKNNGTAESKDTVVTATIPAGTMVVSAEGGTVAGSTITWKAGDLAVGATKTFAYTLKSTAAGTIGPRVSAQGYCAEAVADASNTAIQGIPAVLLEVVDVVDPIEVGGEAEYIITVTNQGTADATNVAVSAKAEASAQFLSGAGATAVALKEGTITMAALPRLAPGEKASWRVKVKALKTDDSRFSVEMSNDQSKRPVNETESTRFY